MRYIRINPKYNHLRLFIESIPEIIQYEGELIKDGRNLIKVFNTPDGQIINVKRYHIPNGPNRLIYSLGLRKPKGQRAYEYPEILLQKGINTPENIAYIEERHGILLGHSYFICTQCPYEHELYEVGHAPEGTYDELAIALATFTAHMHESGVLHRDYSPGNILWNHDAEGYHFSIIDTNRMYFGPVDMKRGCANFARLWGPKQFIVLLASQYAHLRGFDEEQVIETVLKYRARFWKRFLKKHTVSFNVEL